VSRLLGLLAAAALVPSAAAAASPADPALVIPDVADGAKRRIATGDLAHIRDIDRFAISPDGKSYVILVRQADPEANRYRTAWFGGALTGGPLRYLADGGKERLLTLPDGRSAGDIVASAARWSPDGQWFAYAVKRDGAVQLWRTRFADGHTEQVSQSPGDVRDFVWSEDGQRLFFTSGIPLAEQRAIQEAVDRKGTRLQDYGRMSNAIYSGSQPVPLLPNPPLFVVGANGRNQHPAGEAEKSEFEKTRDARHAIMVGGTELNQTNLSSALRPPKVRSDGALAWLENASQGKGGFMPLVRLRASLTGREEDALDCSAAVCESYHFFDTWWSADGSEVIFQVTGGESGVDISVHAWNPATGATRAIVAELDGALEDCDLQGTRLYCIREERLVPNHVAAIDVASGAVDILADVNPEFRNFDLGRLMRLDWDTPHFEYPEGEFATKTRGYLLYPPDYDPRKSYPVFIAPYSNYGFMRGDAGDEHPLLVYAANGFVVLDSEFPQQWGADADCETAKCRLEATYGPEREYPHLRVRAATTIAGLDEAAKHANIDMTRVGIGGVSSGAFIPLHMLLKYDRLTALSIGGGGWLQEEYYTSRMPEPWATEPDPTHYWPKDAEFWKPIDLSYHLETIEAPILFHFADRELFLGNRLVRDMADAHMAVEAYAFADELHEKIQPAHRLTIYNRNLAWFRFWLMDYEDPDPAMAEQYERWRKLRLLQCDNPRSLRAYCS
jgi:dipeptidyl aminopeptidase/acylaminoacyl peptidase